MKSHPSVFMAKGSIVCGDVTLAESVSVWFNAVVRGDLNSIYIGKGSNVQDLAVIHVDHDHPVVVGEGVSVGHGALLHGCSVGDHTLIGMGAIILNGAKIGKNCLIGAGALVTQGKTIPDGSIVFGNPAKVMREITQEEINHIRENANHYVETAKQYIMQLD